uniref:Uncharacterized protein n=1 Tax=Ceratitis capitata TaxID=7213 RepID=W8BG52_CERCA
MNIKKQTKNNKNNKNNETANTCPLRRGNRKQSTLMQFPHTMSINLCKNAKIQNLPQITRPCMLLLRYYRRNKSKSLLATTTHRLLSRTVSSAIIFIALYRCNSMRG